ncbi:hypothetical protein [Viridibacillus arvi]|uniref:hypothetical protein n=1 Tax=Viridibacillus arvi TaxID=263475 RepID=UPI003D009493
MDESIKESLVKDSIESEDIHNTLLGIQKTLEESNKDSNEILKDSLSDIQKVTEESLKQSTETNKDLSDSIQTFSDNLENLPDGSGVGTSALEEKLDLVNENLQATIDLLTSINKSLELVSSACDAILTYSVFFIPLMVIVICLWWFIKQFLR